jgi:glycerol-3-phosphate dehydrogenase
VSQNLDVLIFGGGGAGLWLLDELHRNGFGVLLVESDALGSGQTVGSQGIIHGGVKYTLTGLLSDSAKAIRDMPGVWRDCLAGRREPNLSRTHVLADYCHLWRTETVRSKLGMVGARTGLRSAVQKIAPQDRPDVLALCPGDVFRVDEQVIDPVTFLCNLQESHRERILRVDADQGVEFTASAPGRVEAVALAHRGREHRVQLRPTHVVFTAGQGNATLREQVGLGGDAMQRRPLHMVMIRGRLPSLFGHCVDGARTRVTITAAADSQGRTVWLVGGQVAEDGVGMSEQEVCLLARRELESVLPNVDFSGTHWAAYAVDRAEGKTAGGVRPAAAQVRQEGNTVTAWPTKLALVPELAKLIVQRLGDPPADGPRCLAVPSDWPRAEVALPPWEVDRPWHSLD